MIIENFEKFAQKANFSKFSIVSSAISLLFISPIIALSLHSCTTIASISVLALCHSFIRDEKQPKYIKFAFYGILL